MQKIIYAFFSARFIISAFTSFAETLDEGWRQFDANGLKGVVVEQPYKKSMDLGDSLMFESVEMKFINRNNEYKNTKFSTLLAALVGRKGATLVEGNYRYNTHTKKENTDFLWGDTL